MRHNPAFPMMTDLEMVGIAPEESGRLHQMLREAAHSGSDTQVERALAAVKLAMGAETLSEITGNGEVVAVFVDPGDPSEPTVIFDKEAGDFIFYSSADWIEEWEGGGARGLKTRQARGSIYPSATANPGKRTTAEASAIREVVKVLNKYKTFYSERSNRERSALIHTPILEIPGKVQLVPYWAVSDQWMIDNWVKKGEEYAFSAGVLYYSPDPDGGFGPDQDWLLAGWNSDLHWPAEAFVARTTPARAIKAAKAMKLPLSRSNPANLTHKGERMYEGVKHGYQLQGDERAKEIAARTVYARAREGVPGLVQNPKVRRGPIMVSPYYKKSLIARGHKPGDKLRAPLMGPGTWIVIDYPGGEWGVVPEKSKDAIAWKKGRR